ncbi:MAG TPA: antibiotic biosynthesis monooxygenase family protein [Herpetosiphonaceae bacterium]|nr:antibiotic biosynthesis monooxygenase family protein [Herpetosiphonaceae bacterium]
MSVIRIGEVQAKEEMIAALRDFLISIIPLIQASEGCESCQLLQNQDDATTFVMIEVWNNVESHQASVNNIPPEKLGEIRPLLASPPKGAYYGVVAQP